MITQDRKIQMVDLRAQYLDIMHEVDQAIQDVINQGSFINGPQVKSFTKSLSSYLNSPYVITCGNGTDALQIALMSLELNRGDEIIVPAFTYVATAEVIALLGLKPKIVDVEYDTFNISVEEIKKAITPDTKAIIPVNLYGQCADLGDIMDIASENDIKVIEDNAQSIGSEYKVDKENRVKSGTVGHIGCTSFYPSKNLGAYGDGGAINTSDEELAEKIKMIANHGQSEKYIHDIVGCNSRLDTIQAAILEIKLAKLNDYNSRRQLAADRYDLSFINNEDIIIPKRSEKSTHVFHQYTIKVEAGKRDALKQHLQEIGIPSMIYYPLPLYRQEAFAKYWDKRPLANTEKLCQEVISLPIHPEMKAEEVFYIADEVNKFINR